MSEILPVTQAPVGVVAPHREHELRLAGNAGYRPPARGNDEVELSDLATFLSKLRDLPIRQDVVDAARERIASGLYDSPEAIDAVIEGIIEDLSA